MLNSKIFFVASDWVHVWGLVRQHSVLRRVLRKFWGRVLRRVLRRELAVGFAVKGSEKGVSRRCPERPLGEYDPFRRAPYLRVEVATTLKTLTSINRESRPFFLGNNSIWSFASVSSLSDYSISRSRSLLQPCDHSIWSMVSTLSPNTIIA